MKKFLLMEKVMTNEKKFKDLETIVYEELNKFFPGDYPHCSQCQLKEGCRNLPCPNMKLFLARKIANKIKENE